MIASEQEIKAELLAEYRRARVSPRMFCKVHGVNFRTFSEWLKEDGKPDDTETGFAIIEEPALKFEEAAPAAAIADPVAMPVQDPTILTVRAIKASRNTRFIYAGLPDGMRINVACNPRTRDRLVGKAIRVKVSEDSAGDKTYTHLP